MWRTTIDDGGFSLPVALMALAILYLLVASAFTMSSLETLISRAHESSVRAFYAADGGLEEYLAAVSGLPTDRDLLGTGEAYVTVRAEPLLNLPSFDRLYRLVSTSLLGAEARPRAGRTVGTLVLASKPPLLPAALSAFSGATTAGAAGTISGLDGAVPSSCDAEGRPSIAGLASPDPVEDGPVVLGTPPILALPLPSSVRRTAGVDWPALLDPSGPLRTARIPEDSWPPAPVDSDSSWPVIEIGSDEYELSGAYSGQGTILARGDLTLSEGFNWKGLILVGGALRLSGSVRVEGGILSGLTRDEAGGEASDLRDGTLDLSYHSCYVASAVDAIALRPAVVPGSWFEEI